MNDCPIPILSTSKKAGASRAVWLLLGALLLALPIPLARSQSPETGKESVEDLQRELAHLGEWLIMVEARDGSTDEYPDFHERLRSVLEKLDCDASDEEQLVGLLTDVFQKYKPEALPLLELAKHYEGVDPTWDHLRQLRAALGEYKDRMGRYPTLEEGLAKLVNKDGLGGPYVEAASLLDGWGQEIVYGFWGEATFELRSKGADGQLDNADDLVADERGLHRDDPTYTLGAKVVSATVTGVSFDHETVFVQLALITHHRHWDIALDHTEEKPLDEGDLVEVTAEGAPTGIQIAADAGGWLAFYLGAEALEERLRQGQGKMAVRFQIFDKRFGAPRIQLNEDWAVEIVDEAIKGTTRERLADWEDILSDVPQSATGDSVRQSIETRIEPLREENRRELGQARARCVAAIEAAGGLDPETPAARTKCMQLQIQLAENRLATGDFEEAANAFGNAARHASDNDDLDALEALIERQLTALESVR